MAEISSEIGGSDLLLEFDDMEVGSNSGSGHVWAKKDRGPPFENVEMTWRIRGVMADVRPKVVLAGEGVKGGGGTSSGGKRKTIEAGEDVGLDDSRVQGREHGSCALLEGGGGGGGGVWLCFRGGRH
ncbi:unnamed protein product [Ilex paraguariensis]|uniref:Uncharacterized protein n=1 Tax=Ilex paraguariensis TaxID=185542 RepID=A0ABC8SRU0_9AQUA